MTTTTTLQSTSKQHQSAVVVACAGTMDLPVVEEAAMTLSFLGVPITHVYDCGVARLHWIISLLPELQDTNIGRVIFCAEMDGALLSIVGGLMDVPVVAIPTSVGYRMSLGGMSALLTMLNICSPSVTNMHQQHCYGRFVCLLTK